MRIIPETCLLAVAAGLFAPLAPAQGELTQEMREAIRSIVRQEVRAALRDLGADLGARERREKAEAKDRTREKKAETRKARGLWLGGGDMPRLRWIQGDDDELDAVAIELQEIDKLLEKVGDELQAHRVEIEALPRLHVEFDTKADIEDLTERVQKLHRATPKLFVERGGKVKVLDGGDGKVFWLRQGDDEDEEAEAEEAEEHGEKDEAGTARRFHFVLPQRWTTGKDEENEHSGKRAEVKVEGRGKVMIMTPDGKVIDRDFDLDGGASGFRVWVEDGKVRLEKTGDRDKKKDKDDEKAGRTLVRRRTMV